MSFLVPLLALSLFPYALSQCPLTGSVEAFGNGLIDVPQNCASYSWQLTFPLIPEFDPISLVIQFAPKFSGQNPNLGSLTIEGKDKSTDLTWTTYAVVTGTNNARSVSVSNGATYAPDIAGDLSKGNVLRFRASIVRFVYVRTLASPGYLVLFSVSQQVPGKDLDGDGFIYPNEDCCDTHYACQYPTRANMGAFDIPGNGVVDSAFGNCSNFANEGPSEKCDSSISCSSCVSENVVKAIDICQTTTMSAKTWGVIESYFTRSDGTPLDPSYFGQFQVLSEFDNYYNPGDKFAFLTTNDSCENCNFNTSHEMDQDYLDGNGGQLYIFDGCGLESPGVTTFDSVNLVVKLRAPSNAKSFSFNFKFLSNEFPEYVCTQFTDFFVTLLKRGNDPLGYDSADKNIAFYDDQDTLRPMSINVATFFNVCNGNLPGFTALINCNNQYDGQLFSMNAGTLELTAAANVYPGEVFELNFMVFDVGDADLDTVVMINNFKWSTESINGLGVVVDQCLTDNGGCALNALCTNTPQGPLCTCPNGFDGNGLSCQDINECESGNGGCGEGNCINTQGSRNCNCNPGYFYNGNTCADVDECSSNNGDCGASSTCQNTIGSFTCTQANGCVINNGGCSLNASCIDTQGSISCVCFSGFEGDGKTCTPTARISDMLTFRPYYRFFLDGNTVDSSGNNGVILIGSYSYTNFYNRANPNNQALRINDGPGVVVTNVPVDGTFSVHMIINSVSNANVNDLVRVIGSDNQPSLTIRVATTGKLIFLNGNGVIVGTTKVVIRTGRSYFVIFSYRQSTISTFVDTTELGKFPVTIPNGSYSLSIGKGMNGFLDEVSVYDTATFGSNFLVASEQTRCLRSCPSGNVCYNTATSTEICSSPI